VPAAALRGVVVRYRKQDTHQRHRSAAASAPDIACLKRIGRAPVDCC
jgi:hypothetical protein